MLQMGTSRRELWSGVLEATGVNCPYFPTLENEACQTMLMTTEVTYGDLYYVFFSFCPLHPTLSFTSVAKLSNRSSYVLSHFNNRADFTCCFGRTKGSRLSADIYSCKLPQQSLCFAVCIGIHRYLQWVKAVNKKIRILVSVMMGLLNSFFYKLILFYYYIYFWIFETGFHLVQDDLELTVSLRVGGFELLTPLSLPLKYRNLKNTPLCLPGW